MGLIIALYIFGFIIAAGLFIRNLFATAPIYPS